MTEYGDAGATQSGGGGGAMTPNTAFLKGPPGWLKIAQAVLSLITFICATSSDWFVRYNGGGWVQFVSIVAFLITGFQIIFYVLNLDRKIPQRVPLTLIELVYYTVTALLYLISLIVAAVKASYHSGIAAATFFCLVCMVLYGADAVQTYFSWRRGGGSMGNLGGTPSNADRSGTADSIGTTDITPGVYAGSDLRNPDQVY